MVDASCAFPKSGFVRVSSGQAIFQQGGAAHPAFMIEEGCARVSTDDSCGRAVVVTFLFRGDTLCAGVYATWASAFAVSDCVLSTAPYPGDDALLAASDGMLHEVVGRFARCAQLDAPARVLWFLHWVAIRTGRLPGQNLDLPMGRRDIADFLAIAPATLERAMRALENRGELRWEGLQTCHFTVEPPSG